MRYNIDGFENIKIMRIIIIDAAAYNNESHGDIDESLGDDDDSNDK